MIASVIGDPGQVVGFSLASSSYHDLAGRPGGTDLNLDIQIAQDSDDISGGSNLDPRTIPMANSAVSTIPLASGKENLDELNFLCCGSMAWGFYGCVAK